MTETTFARINSREELNAAIDGLFGEDRAWVKEYFGSQGFIQSVADRLSSSDLSDEYRAFSEAADTLLPSIFKHDFSAVRHKTGLEFSVWSGALGDTVVSADEYASVVSERASDDLRQARSQMGPELTAKFDTLMVGILNGIADDAEGERIYSTEELETEQVFPRRLIGELNEHFVDQMNEICGAIEDANIRDFEIAPNTPKAAKEIFLGV